MKCSTEAGLAAAVRDEYERLSALTIRSVELPSILTQIVSGAVTRYLTPARPARSQKVPIKGANPAWLPRNYLAQTTRSLGRRRASMYGSSASIDRANRSPLNWFARSPLAIIAATAGILIT